jgi:8-oxo-dGTP diphosphatase
VTGLELSARARPMRPILAASVAVIRDRRVLLAMRTKKPAEGLFSLPGGRVELGETLEEAALRELSEEVAVTASIVGFNDHMEVIERSNDGAVAHHFVIASFVARWVSGNGEPGPEARRVLWATLDEISGLRTTRGLQRIAARAFKVFSLAQGAP